MLLAVDELKVQYRNGALGILDVSLEVDEGQVIAMFGPNGAGKTTSVRGMTGFLRSEGARVVNGQVRFRDRDITNWEPHRSNRLGVAFVPERRKIFANLSVAENLVALGRLPERRVRKQVYESVYTLFPILKEREREYAGRLSGGQQQMLALASSLVGEPRLLVVDEMTLGLHHSMQAPLFEAVRRIASEGTAVLVVDESAGFALEVADHCYLLDHGSVTDHGPPSQFRGTALIAKVYGDEAPA